MPAKVYLRELTAEEHQAGERLARSRTDEARSVQRARAIERLAVGERPGAARRASNIVCPFHAEPTHAIGSNRP
jgi:hypothetical protein